MKKIKEQKSIHEEPGTDFFNNCFLQVRPAASIPFQFNDGGRAEAGYKGFTGDCVVRSIAIAAKKPYKQVYKDLFRIAKNYKGNGKKAAQIKAKASPRLGVHKEVYHSYILGLGFTWVSCMGIGTGCKVHVHPEELPEGRLILSLSRHISCFINGVLHDTYDCSREGTRCVYGYYIKNK